MRIRRQDGAGDRGAAAVEFALLMPVFLVLTFGAITTGTAVSHKSALTQAARESARFGATLGLDSGIDTWLTKVKSAVVGAAGSDFEGGSPYWCVAYVAPLAITGQQVTRSLSSTSPLSTTTPCFTDARTDAHVQVQLRRTSDLDLGITTMGLKLDSKSISRFER